MCVHIEKNTNISIEPIIFSQMKTPVINSTPIKKQTYLCLRRSCVPFHPIKSLLTEVIHFYDLYSIVEFGLFCTLSKWNCAVPSSQFGFLHLILCFWDLVLSLHVVVCHLRLVRHSMLLSQCTMVCLFILPMTVHG